MWLNLVLIFLFFINYVFSNYWEIMFLGTGACYPTPRHALSSLILRFPNGEVFLFDCGEGTQLQLAKSFVRPTKITKIFITHLHGDHFFGLPGLLATITAHVTGSNSVNLPPKHRLNHTVHVYGPQGLRSFMHHTFLLSENTVKIKYKIHELRIPPELFINRPPVLDIVENTLNCSANIGIRGRDIYEKDNIWDIFSNGIISVKATMIKHKVPTFGYVISEKDTLGNLNVDKLRDIGLDPGPFCKNIKEGKPFKAKDGRIIEASEVLGPTVRGRKVTILGDTANPYSIRKLAMNSDVVVHEATFQDKDTMKANRSLHSTPSMAALFAKKIRAKTLILNHFSQRYSPSFKIKYAGYLDDRTYNKTKFTKHTKKLTSIALYRLSQKVSTLEEEARRMLRMLKYPCEVKTAKEFMVVTVKRNIKKEKKKAKKLEKLYCN
ncbi:ribonuclease Z-like [Lycorma delicatula]|uniref:ribonuclease Z-like n=1 Tax=Lycorma delicatula TaxID=130591 RepID=UPI003F50D6AF